MNAPCTIPKYHQTLDSELMAEAGGQSITEVMDEMVGKLFKNPALIAQEFSMRPMRDVSLAHALTGCGSEGSELGDIAKKIIFHNKPVDQKMLEHVMEEFGDLTFYLVSLANTLQQYGIESPLTKAMAMNIDKLWLSKNARYSEGTYSDAQAHARADKQATGETTSSLAEINTQGKQDVSTEEHY